MIRPIDIRLNAAHPDLPLAEAVTYTGAPSTVLIRGVPGNCGRWAITAVFVAATFPDGSTSTRTAVQSANGVWVATLPATATSGRTAHGLRILADGADENGEAVSGYVLGVADFAVASLAVTPAPEPGETSWQMLYFDAVPGVLRKGDVTKVDGVLKLYNGTAWEAFANVPDPSTATPAMDGTGSAGSSAAFARGDHVHPTDTSRVPTSRTVNGKALDEDVTLTGADIAVSGTDATKIDAALAGKATKADVTLAERGDPSTPGFSSWTIDGFPSGWTYSQPAYNEDEELPSRSYWSIVITSPQGDTSDEYANVADPNAVELNFGSGPGMSEMIATRTALPGYVLGPDNPSNPNRDKPLASEAEAEALRTGKQNALTAQQLANIAAVSDALAFDATHSYAAGDPVVYDGTLYTFTAAHTGAWTGSDVSAVDIIARLAGKLDKSGGTVTGDLTIGANSNYSAKFEGDASGAVSLMLRDSVGNTLYISGGKLFYRQYNWPSGVELYFPSTDGTLALTANIPYNLVTKTISNGAVTLDDHAMNAVSVSSSLASLTINFPTATSGRVRDFGLRLSVASGITTAPELVLPQGVTCENADGEVPEIGADGAATILYFTETASGVFLVKGEVVTAIS